MRRLSYPAARLARCCTAAHRTHIGEGMGALKGGLLIERDAGDAHGRQDKAGTETVSYRDSLVESVGREYELTAFLMACCKRN